ncbi:MAG: MFS transporter [Candidatus Rokubacteria bacterium]|nr:MFS transporter [Candidatus Rokubacteria bacterium]
MADSRPAAYGDAAVPTLVPSTFEQVRPHVRLIGLLALGHFVVDLMQGALPALLPFLKSAHGLSYAATGMIVLASTLASSIVQPLFGYLADQTARRWMLPISVVLAGVGFALLGVAPSYAAVLALVLAMGLGVAAFHPEAYKTATSVAGDRKATALSWFTLGGNAGIALGPPVIAILVTTSGLAGSLGMLVPAGIMAALLVGVLPRLSDGGARASAAARARHEEVNRPGAMALLVLVVMLRSWTSLGFTTFVPFYYLDVLHAEPRVIGTVLFVYLGAGALGTVVVGPLADRWGTRPFMVWSLLAVTPLFALFLNVTGALAFVALALMGATVVSTFTVAVVLGQQYLPRNSGMASGLIVGFATGTGGLGVTLLGWIADTHGLMSALWISALMPFAGFAAAWFLPTPRHA